VRAEPYRSAKHAAAKQRDSCLTWEVVGEIRRRVTGGEKQQVVADSYGITNQAVDLIVRNVRWRDPGYCWEGFVRTCERPGCSTTFTTRLANKAYCCGRCRSLHNQRTRTGYYLRHAEADAERRTRRRRRDMLRQPWQLDALAGQEGSTLAELVADEGGEYTTHVADQHVGDPLAEVIAGELRGLLDGLTEDEVDRLSEAELVALRARLARAGYVPAAR
jgi:hypothetical protein